jgi:hypothetical protein
MEIFSKTSTKISFLLEFAFLSFIPLSFSLALIVGGLKILNVPIFVEFILLVV